ncbi:DUF2247 family protein [Enterobacter mori]|uniref:DUF2247 family protein n=1 Tax=Enterobacter mori TaxID=539813 RepID=UPI001B8C02FA|nr:DUF2247 family protein [Enterobacter mori]MBS3047339.1 DUF2247 family protein [Enterobacter mori]
MSIYPISLEFIEDKAKLSWCDIKWAYEHNLITASIPVRKAEKKVLAGNYSDAELNLSFLSPKQPENIMSCLNIICSEEGGGDWLKIKRKWLFITLSWLWNNRESFSEPLGEVESVYSDFDYPVEMESFIKYFPPSDGYDPSIHTYEENIERLMRNWEFYLKKESAIFKC